ncbi:MAG TPA: cation:proton antiporter [Gemmatimonas sp.]|uniref:cation:proton antiporter n=1 Tax=Gemmatimonas sp. TaxID=1962908 RepID=UPI002ED8CEF0
MHDAHAFLANLTLVLCVAAFTTYLFQRIRQPVVFGYLVAGMIVGPHVGVPVFADLSMVTTLSELGVIMLMFGLGLEFSLRKLVQVGPTAGVVALVDTSVMLVFGYGAGQLLGWSTLESVFCGAIVAISSTTIIVKAFAEQGVKGRFTELVFGILISEDLIAILLIAVLTTVAAGGGVSAGEVGMTAGKLVLFLGGFVGIGLLVVPRLVRTIVRLDRPETTLIVSLGLCFGGALLALGAGYSVALGAFIMGSLVSESGEARRVEHLIAGVRDMFGAIFFVSVGMMIDPRLVAENWGAVVLLSVVVIAGKLIAVSTGAFLTGNDVRTSTQAGMSLTQIGEFAFIIAALGLSSGVVREFLYPVAVAVSAITTLTTPLLIRASGPFASMVDRNLPRPLQTFVGLYGSWIERLRVASADAGLAPLIRRKVIMLAVDALLLAGVVIGVAFAKAPLAGYVASTTALSPAVSTVVLYAIAALVAAPLIVGIVRVSAAFASLLAYRALPRAEGNRLDYAQAPRQVLMATLQLALVTVSGLLVVVVTGPFVPLGRGAVVLALVVGWLGVVFWRSTANLYGHTRAGAQVLIAALAKGMVAHQEAHGAEEAVGGTPPPRDFSMVHRVLPGLGDPVPVLMLAESPAVGRTLGELQLRSLTGAVVLAITRGEEQVMLPVGSERLLVGDIVALAGSSEAIDAARLMLQLG